MYGRRNAFAPPAGDNTINASANVGTTQNRHTFYGDTTRPMFAATIYALVMLTMVVLVMCLLFREWVIRAIIVVFATLVAALVALLVLFIVRYGAGTIAHVFISWYTAAWHKVVYTDGTHTMVKDEHGEIWVHDLTYVTENRQILPESTEEKYPWHHRALVYSLSGMSTNAIMKAFKEDYPPEKRPKSHGEVQSYLDTHNPGHRDAHTKNPGKRGKVLTYPVNEETEYTPEKLKG